MRFTRLYTDEHGETQFEPATFESATTGGDGTAGASLPVPATAVTLRTSPRLTAGEELHNCPRRQFVLVLSAAMEIETSQGDTKVFRPGDILFVEDLTGRGHRLRHLGPEEIRILLVPVDDSWSPTPAVAGSAR